MRSFFAVFAALMSFGFAGSAFAADPSQIARSAVESGETAETVRLVVSPAVENLESKIVCSPDSIRVRFQGIKPAVDDIDDLSVPHDGPMRKVRVVPRGANNSVVQIFARGRQMDACYRTTVMVVDDEVVISMALNDREKTRRNRILEARAAKTAARRQIEEAVKNAPQAPEISEKVAAAAVEPRPEEAREDRAEEGAQAKNGLAEILEIAKRKEPAEEAPAQGATAKADAEDEEKKIDGAMLGLAGVTGGGDDSDGLRYLAGIGFALLVAGIAWYIKRRRGGIRGDIDSIDILSQKRLSAHQSLIVAQVHGHKFLLAVGDKTVTNLGMLPEEQPVVNATVPMYREPVYAAPPRPQAPIPRHEVPRAPEPMPRPAPQAQARQSTRSFEELISEEIYGRTEPGIPIPRTAPPQPAVPTETRGFGEATPSNVAGLINMARMRANFNGSARNAPTAEA